jgi:hypothetical protein
MSCIGAADAVSTVQLCCAWCGRWAEADAWVTRAARSAAPTDGVPVSHGICPDCLGRMQRQARPAPSARRRPGARRRARADAGPSRISLSDS